MGYCTQACSNHDKTNKIKNGTQGKASLRSGLPILRPAHRTLDSKRSVYPPQLFRLFNPNRNQCSIQIGIAVQSLRNTQAQSDTAFRSILAYP
jgi:hypothetical protein